MRLPFRPRQLRHLPLHRLDRSHLPERLHRSSVPRFRQRMRHCDPCKTYTLLRFAFVQPGASAPSKMPHLPMQSVFIVGQQGCCRGDYSCKFMNFNYLFPCQANLTWPGLRWLTEAVGARAMNSRWRWSLGLSKPGVQAIPSSRPRAFVPIYALLDLTWH